MSEKEFYERLDECLKFFGCQVPPDFKDKVHRAFEAGFSAERVAKRLALWRQE